MLRGDHESRALSGPAGGRGPLDHDNAGPGAGQAQRVHHTRIGRPDGPCARAAKAPEHLPGGPAAEHPPEAGEHVVRGTGHEPADATKDHRVVDLSRHRRERRAGHRRSDEPRDEQDRHRTDGGSTGRIHDRGRAPGQPRPQGRAGQRGEQLPGQRDQKDHDDGHQRPLGRAAHQGLRDARGKRRTGRRPAQKSNDAQRANDEPLPVTIHGERGREHHQDHIEQVTRHPLTV